MIACPALGEVGRAQQGGRQAHQCNYINYVEYLSAYPRLRTSRGTCGALPCLHVRLLQRRKMRPCLNNIAAEISAYSFRDGG